MKFGRFALDGRAFYGLVEGDEVYELDGSPFKSSRRSERRHGLTALKLLLPCMPSNFYCAGLNYAAQ